jgi:hypothetical protein
MTCRGADGGMTFRNAAWDRMTGCPTRFGAARPVERLAASDETSRLSAMVGRGIVAKRSLRSANVLAVSKFDSVRNSHGGIRPRNCTVLLQTVAPVTTARNLCGSCSCAGILCRMRWILERSYRHGPSWIPRWSDFTYRAAWIRDWSVFGYVDRG